MEAIQPYLDAVLTFMRQGFNEANQTNALLIALAATIFMQNWRQWIPIAALAVIVHAAIEVIVPALAGQGALRLPPLFEAPFWQTSIARFAGYLIVIGIFFMIKRLIFRGGRAAAH